jgi:hypothetical protein
MNVIRESLRYKHVFSSLYFCSHALQELRTLTNTYELDEVNKLVGKAPFNFYKASLIYLICLEYCKLFSPREPKEKMSNVMELWKRALELYPKLIDERSHPSVVRIQSIHKQELLSLILDLRNKRFAHSDQDLINKPFNIRSFSTKELESIATDLDAAIDILYVVSQQEDYAVVGFPHQFTGSNQTRTFIHTAAIAESFIYKNINLAYAQGYQLHQQKIVSPTSDSTQKKEDA